VSISIKELVTGRKVFFITPDTSLFPKSYLEDFFALGYECYFIEYDKRVALKTKVDILLSVFNDVILFFNIDYNPNEINWHQFISEIISKYGDRAMIGVLYTKRQRKEEKLQIEKRYLYDLGIRCGCCQLEYQKKQNFEIIERILAANQAQGRRKQIRAMCTKAYTFSVVYEGQQLSGVLQDVSLSHFSLVIPEDKLKLPSYIRLTDFRFNLKGCMFTSDAILIMSRPTPDGILYVFAFTNASNSGLDSRIKQLLIPNIYQLMNSNFTSLIKQIYTRIDETSGSSSHESSSSNEDNQSI